MGFSLQGAVKYSKCTQPSVMTAVTSGRQGPTLHGNSSLLLAVQMRGRPIGIRLSSFQPYADGQKVKSRIWG
jgi:hypothetical protein